MTSDVKKSRVMIVASEASGDIHGAKVIKAVQAAVPRHDFSRGGWSSNVRCRLRNPDSR